MQHHVLFLAAAALILALEWMIPASKKQPLFSRGMFQDFVWFVLAMTARTLLTFVIAKNALSLVPYEPSETLLRVPQLVRFISGVFAADFLARFHHQLQHNVPYLWGFHQVHHTQIQLNFLTAARIHIFDYILLQLCLMGPLFLLGVDAAYIAFFSVFVNWQSRFCHANLKTHLGPLRFIFVTPQSHRVHHSIEARHLDKNFGITFSVWDRFFGTLYDGSSDYPEVGVKTPTIPVEVHNNFMSMLQTPFLQLLSPIIPAGLGLWDQKKKDR